MLNIYKEVYNKEIKELLNNIFIKCVIGGLELEDKLWLDLQKQKIFYNCIIIKRNIDKTKDITFEKYFDCILNTENIILKIQDGIIILIDKMDKQISDYINESL